MPGVFRRGWFPRRKAKIGLAPLNDTLSMIGVAAATQLGVLTPSTASTLTGVAASTAVESPTPSISLSPSVFVSAIAGTQDTFSEAGSLPGLFVTTAVNPLSLQISSNVSIIGNQAIVSAGHLIGDHPIILLNGVFATTQYSSFFSVSAKSLLGQAVKAEVPTFPFFDSPNVFLNGVRVTAIIFQVTGAGGGGGGAAGPAGVGQKGFDGSAVGDGGHGGYGDGGIVLGAVVPGATGNNGAEFAVGYGIGSGGAGASFSAGAGATVYNYNGTIFISYKSSSTGQTVFTLLDTTDNVNSPFTIPFDWTNTNAISLTGSGCATHGENTIVTNTSLYSPNQQIPFFCSPFCSQLPTTFGTILAVSGSATAPTMEQGAVGGDGGIYGGGGGGGTGGGGGRGGDGLIFIQYRSTSDNLIHQIVFKVIDNKLTPWVVPLDWSESNFIVLVGAGGCGGVGGPTDGANGGGGGSCTGAWDTNAFFPGNVVPFFVGPGCSGLPTILGRFKADAGQNGDTGTPPDLGLFDHFDVVFPCGSGGDGTVGPMDPITGLPWPPGAGSRLVE